MRTPPPVSALLEQDRLWQWACAGLSGLAGVCLGVWLTQHSSTWFDQPLCRLLLASFASVCALWPWVLPVLLGGAAGVAAWRYAGVERLVMRWTGSEWQAWVPEDASSTGGAPPDHAQLAVGQPLWQTGVSHPGASRMVNGFPDSSALTCEPALMIDLGQWMLLHLRFPDQNPRRPSRSSWHAVSASQMDPWSWHGLRVALHCARSLHAVGVQARPAVATGARRKPGDLSSKP